MSLATRCPACGTIFRVVQDQLKVSEGWVRCGQCHEVFHGIEALFDLESDPALAARRAAPRVPAAPPPTRVFADARANAPIPSPAAAVPSPEPEPNRPLAPTPQTVQATPSAFGQSDSPRSTANPPAMQPGFAPAVRPVPIPPVATRGTIAPRFAARLAEESARAQAAPAPSPIPSAFPGPVSGPTPFDSTRAQAVEPNGAAERPTSYAPTPPPAHTPVPSYAPMPTAAYAPAPAPVFAPPPPLPAAPARSVEPVAQPQRPPGPPSTPPPVFAPPAPLPLPASAADLADSFAARPWPEPTAPPPRAPAPPADDASLASLPSTLDDEALDEAARAGPPTLASMLPEDAGEWPPRRTRRKGAAQPASGELAVVPRRDDPRFLREARSGARWRKPWVRAVLSMALVLLVVAAAGQVAWPQRDTLASRWPATLPAWTWFCEQAGCRIEPPRALASLALDGSSLTRTDAEHVLLFSADLHNRADHAVRMPSFDLTFMDLNGEIVARKVLSPAQIGIRQAALPAEGDLHVHARLQVGNLDASGFQADLFYP